MMPQDESTPIAWFIRCARQEPAQPALITHRCTWTYDSLMDHLGRLTAWFERMAPTKPGEPHAVVTRKAARFAWAVYLALYRGHPLLLLDPRRSDLPELLKNCGITHVFTDGDFSDRLASDVQQLPSVWLETSPDVAPRSPSPASAADVQIIISTSGTEGCPRGVMLTNDNLCAAVQSARARVNLESGDVWLVCLPLFHIGGLAILFRCMDVGATVVLHERFDPKLLWNELDRRRVTHLSLVPAMLSRVLEVSNGRRPPPSLRTVLVGGGPLSPRLVQRALTNGWAPCVTYGLSETASQVATFCHVDEKWETGDVGKPLPGARIDVVNSEGEAVADQGRIRIVGPMVMAGYANPAGIRGLGLTDGHFISNDLGYIDRTGHLHVVGRADDMLIIAGENIHPLEVEARLLECKGVADVAVTALPDEDLGQHLIALVVGGVEVSTVRTWSHAHLPGSQRPRTFVKIDSIPRNELGKLNRSALRQWVKTLRLLACQT
jgi:O-succinylbenzoic acid--CoA ligase